MESISRGTDVNDETVESLLVGMLLVLLVVVVDIDCPDAAKLSDVVRSDNEVVLDALFALEALSVPSARENSADVGAALLDEAGASLEVFEAWNVDA